MSNLPPILPPIPGSLNGYGDKDRIDKINQLAQVKRQIIATSDPNYVPSSPNPSQPGIASTPIASQPQYAPIPVQISQPVAPQVDPNRPFANAPTTYIPSAVASPVIPAQSPVPQIASQPQPTVYTPTSVPITPVPQQPIEQPVLQPQPVYTQPVSIPDSYYTPPSVPPVVAAPVYTPTPVQMPQPAPPAQIAPAPVVTSPVPQIASQPVPVTTNAIEAIYNTGANQDFVPTANAKNLYGWNQVASEIKRILDYAPNTVIRLAVQDKGILTIDPKYQAYQWSSPLTEFPLEIGSATLDAKKVEDGDPAILTQPGSEMGDILWLIGYNAFKGSRATWLNDNERYKLQKWPNLTSLGVGMEVVLISATLGNTPASAEELALSGGVSKEQANNIVNALSLMGLLSVHPYQGKTKFKGISNNKDSLFNRLRQRWGR